MGTNVVANVAGGGEGQQFHSHADHGVGEGKREQLATVGTGFKTEFRKITRARRRYCGGPDGRVQVCLTDLGFSGDEKCFQNLGGGQIPTLGSYKKMSGLMSRVVQAKTHRATAFRPIANSI